MASSGTGSVMGLRDGKRDNRPAIGGSKTNSQADWPSLAIREWSLEFD
jgi:hypothetical protein